MAIVVAMATLALAGTRSAAQQNRGNSASARHADGTERQRRAIDPRYFVRRSVKGTSQKVSFLC